AGLGAAGSFLLYGVICAAGYLYILRICVLETTPGAHLPHSRENHWCWNTDNPEKSDESF
ncbi:hypothetical protein ACTXQV_37970, partial [Klebsiella pneumoniae]